MVMAIEVLHVPEQHLMEVIGILRVGLAHTPGVSPEVREALTTWCDDEERYMKGVDEEGDSTS
jgi:hypothetical protein